MNSNVAPVFEVCCGVHVMNGGCGLSTTPEDDLFVFSLNLLHGIWGPAAVRSAGSVSKRSNVDRPTVSTSARHHPLARAKYSA